ncbi:MAG: transposase [Verrucomicrobiales bacterium]
MCRDIGMLSGKRNVATQRKELYLKMFTRVARFERIFKRVLEQARRAVDKANRGMQLLPFKKSQADANLLQAQSDIEKLVIIAAYSRKRIVEEKQTSSSDKIYSIADIDAAIIRKGGWQDVLGYKPQLAFTGKGLVSAILHAGNAADNGQLPQLLTAVEVNTGKLPRSVTVDDGYTCAAVRDDYLKRGVEIFSYAGANGKRVIGEETYNSESYRRSPRAICSRS